MKMGPGRGLRQQKGRGGKWTWSRTLQALLLLVGVHFVLFGRSCSRFGFSLFERCHGTEAEEDGGRGELRVARSLRRIEEPPLLRAIDTKGGSEKEREHRMAVDDESEERDAAIGAASLRQRSTGKPPRFVFYRIIGNDMPPLQSIGQLRRNTEYLLKHEPQFPECEKRWVLNRMANRTEKALIRALLERHGYVSRQIVDIPFDVDSLARASPGSAKIALNPILFRCKTPEDELQQLGQRIRDFMGLNSGRNAAIEDGVRSGARWILCFDANQFVPHFSWDRIARLARRADRSLQLRYLEVPMVRLKREQSPRWLHAQASLQAILSHSEGRMEEGQLVFRNDSTERFNENMAYSLAPKQDLLDRTCSFNSTTCLCHDKVWWWTIKTPRSMAARIAPCGVSVRLWSYPEAEAMSIKVGDGNARRDMRIKSAKRFVEYVDQLIAQRRKELQL